MFSHFLLVRKDPFFKTLDNGIFIFSDIKVILIGFNATLLVRVDNSGVYILCKGSMYALNLLYVAIILLRFDQMQNEYSLEK